jgi:hypothetical protein
VSKGRKIGYRRRGMLQEVGVGKHRRIHNVTPLFRILLFFVLTQELSTVGFAVM